MIGTPSSFTTPEMTDPVPATTQIPHGADERRIGAERRRESLVILIDVGSLRARRKEEELFVSIGQGW